MELSKSLLLGAAESSANFTLAGEGRKVTQKAVIDCLLASFDANTKRVFIVVCSYSEQRKLIELLEASGRIEKHLKHSGDTWLKGAESFNGMPTIFFKQFRSGNEEALAGWCFHHARMFINSDYINAKGLVVSRAAMTQPDNAITLYKEASPVVDKVYITDFPKLVEFNNEQV
ncbi:hypothetical protein P3551_22940 [Vibrio parahaemolyticus]|nr:hypothetical protein [Vibrio parahaemolyticus]